MVLVAHIDNKRGLWACAQQADKFVLRRVTSDVMSEAKQTRMYLFHKNVVLFGPFISISSIVTKRHVQSQSEKRKNKSQ